MTGATMQSTGNLVSLFLKIKSFTIKLRRRIIVFCLLIFSASSSFSQTTTETLSSWEFRKTGDAKWLQATVPGTVHTDLLNLRLIEDPYYGDNENKLQWIDTSRWEYRTSFDCDSATFNTRHLELEFEGLDTYAKVYLNDVLILTADNMFRTWKVNCKRILKEENNRLVIKFEPASRKGKALAKKLPYTLPGEERVFTRKAAYQYGWDFSPRFVTCGIWRPVKLVAWNFFHINSIHIIQDELTDSVASLVAEVNITGDEPTTVYSKMLLGPDLPDSLYFEQPIHSGENILNLPFKIRNPKRWWCNGLGEPYLYQVMLQATSPMSDSEVKRFSIGLRTLQFVQEEDSIGRSFQFRLNGVPVFMKGANYVPADNFLPRITRERYREIIQSAADVGMNMLRVWGGGVYEDDQFYNQCDEKGILVWQDFMFAGAMYPGDSAFLENVRLEAEDNVIRLRNHPCLALWCGNNEIEEGWNNWGWQKQYNYSEIDSAKIQKDYVNLFRDMLAIIVERNDPMRSYWQSSPSLGWGDPQSFLEGDSHYWGVWWGKQPFDSYKTKVGRFMSEYGFQGMPSLNSLRKFSGEGDSLFSSPVLKNHQKHATGYETIQKYLDENFKQPKDFENHVYVSQLLQAEGIRTAIEAHRRAKPYCMGTLYWQLNDCWPGSSWSSTDYYGEWKAAHYEVKKAYQKYLVSPVSEEGILNVYIVSDNKDEMNASLDMKLMDFSGVVKWSKSVPVSVWADRSKIYFTVDSSAFRNTDPAGVVLSTRLLRGREIISENMFYFNATKDLNLVRTQVSSTLTAGNGQARLELESKSLAKNVFIDFGDAKVKLSDNYFDLLPGEKKTVLISTNENAVDLEKKLKVKSLVDTY